MTTLHEALGGDATVERLAEAWHERCLANPVVAHAFSHGFHPQHTHRLAAYWIEALGGEARYSGALGSESDVVRMHSGNGDAGEMYAAGAACFEAALGDAGITDATLRRELLACWADSTARMDAYPDSPDDVPDGLTLPRWEETRGA